MLKRTENPNASFPIIMMTSALVLLLCTSNTEGGPNTKVYITNRLDRGADLQLHCRDKYHDLGDHIISYGATYEFDIWIFEVFKTTLYFCGFVIDDTLLWFDIYVQLRDEFLCHADHPCRWEINNSGPCFVVLDRVNCYSWSPNASITGT